MKSSIFIWLSIALAFSLLAGWGPAAFAQGSVVTAKRKASVKSRNSLKPKKSSSPKTKSNNAKSKKSKTATKVKPKPAEQNSGRSEEDDVGESTDDDKSEISSSSARDLAIRSVGIGKISVLAMARKEVPRNLEARLAERLVQDLKSKTFFEPQPVDGNFSSKSSARVLAEASSRAKTDGLFVFEIGLEEIVGYLASASGARLRTFEIRYLVGELEEANAVSILADRIVEGIVQAVPYRGFVTNVENSKVEATINLGSAHGLKEGDVVELFELRRSSFNSTRRRMFDVKVVKVVDASESRVTLLDEAPDSQRIELYSKVSFSIRPPVSAKPTPVVEATGQSVVVGRWWFGFGGEISSYGAIAAAPQYESQIVKVNGAPFGYLAAGNDLLTFRGAFGSARSDTETLGFLDGQGTYNVYQFGSAQTAWTLAAGARFLLTQVTPSPRVISALESTNTISPMVEIKYHYVPKSRIRLVGTGEVFWPIYSSGASVGAMPFAFGAGLGGGLQIALTPKFGFEVSGKVRYLRRLVDGQNGVQESQSTLSTGLLFSF